MPATARQGRWTVLLMALALVPRPAAGEAVDAILVALSDTAATWALPTPPDWTPPARLSALRGGLQMVAVDVKRREVTARIVRRAPNLGLRIGDRHALIVGDSADGVRLPEQTPAPALTATGTVVRIDGERVWVAVEDEPEVAAPARVRRGEDPVGEVTWVAPDTTMPRSWLGRWRAGTANAGPRLGDRVIYRQGAAAPRAPSPTSPGITRPPPPREDRGQEVVIPGDDPFYDLLASLAGRGLIPDASQRQFNGEVEAVYTRKQIVDLLVPAIEEILSWNPRYPFDNLGSTEASHLLWAIQRLERELAARGFDLREIYRYLDSRGASSKTWVVSGWADGRVQSGDDVLAGRLEGTVLGRYGERLRAGLTLGVEGGQGLLTNRDRSNLTAYFLEYNPSRHLTLGVGRLPMRYGPGISSLLWSDRARPPDSLYGSWRTKVFGRPFSIRQHTGYFREGGMDKYVTVRRYEYLPVSKLTLGLNFGLITDRAGQAAASMVLPLYLTRFVSGQASAGGRGNFVGSVDASYRFSRQWAVYGELFADDYDFSPSPPRTAQRVGYLAGVHYTPKWARPGTSYRIEGVILPDTGTYVAQQNVGLGWLRDGVLFGHEYGQDSAGVRIEARQRLSPKFDVSVRYEFFRQLRELPLPAENERFDFGARYDVTRRLGFGIGFQHHSRRNLGGLRGNDETDNTFFLEGRAGY